MDAESFYLCILYSKHILVYAPCVCIFQHLFFLNGAAST